MDTHAVPRKTDKGRKEIATRKQGLNAAQRQVLIMVNGKTSVERLLVRDLGIEAFAEILQHLHAEGFITFDGEVDLSVQNPPAASAAAAKVQLIDAARDLLGRNAGRVVQKLNAAPDTKEGLEAAITNGYKIIKLLIDERKANTFVETSKKILASN